MLCYLKDDSIPGCCVPSRMTVHLDVVLPQGSEKGGGRRERWVNGVGIINGKKTMIFMQVKLSMLYTAYNTVKFEMFLKELQVTI